MDYQVLACFYSPPRACDSRSETSTESDEHHNDEHIHFSPADLSRNISSKAKSSLCRNFTQKGYCPYGKKCQFAHGPEELRINMEANRSYKTKGCHAFQKRGYCCYGSRCNFIHEQLGLASTAQKWSSIYKNHRETIKEVGKESRLIQLLRGGAGF